MACGDQHRKFLLTDYVIGLVLSEWAERHGWLIWQLGVGKPAHADVRTALHGVQLHEHSDLSDHRIVQGGEDVEELQRIVATILRERPCAQPGRISKNRMQQLHK